MRTVFVLVCVAVSAADASSSPLKNLVHGDVGNNNHNSPPSILRANPLRGLPSLPKPHFSWPFPQGLGYLNNGSAGYLDGFLHDYVRITGSCPLGLATTSATEVTVCGAVCAASAKDPTACIALNYSPWYAKFPGSDPTVTGPAETAELEFYTALLRNVTIWLKQCPDCGAAGVGAVLLDSEKFSVSPDSPSAVSAAVTRKCDLIFNATSAAFPAARVEWYNRGTVSLSYTYGWVGPIDAPASLVRKQWNHFTLNERGDTFSCSLYNLRDLYLMRETYRRTVEVARTFNSTGPWAGRTRSVTPWLALGCGDLTVPSLNCSGNEQRYNEPCSRFDFGTPYDPVQSWQFGSEMMNLTRYGNTEDPTYTPSDAFAPWDTAEVVCLYPSILDARGETTAGGSTSLVDHFVAYIRGASGLEGVAP